MSANAEINLARKKLAEALGEDMKHYLLILKSWFRQNISREEFDCDARKLIPQEYLHLHNQFLLTILSRCQMLGSSLAAKDTVPSQHLIGAKGKKVKVKKRPPSKTGFNQRFVPADCLKSAPPAASKPAEEEGGILFCAREMVLPDNGMIHGRLLVSAWECGLDDVTDGVVNILRNALENVLKNVVTATLSRRSAYRLREKRFKYNVGVPVPRVYLRNTLNLHQENEQVPVPSSSILPSEYDTEEMNQASSLACASESEPPRTNVSMYDMMEGLRQFRPCLPSHTLYSTTSEKILHRIWHPSHEELEHDELFRQEEMGRQETATRMMLSQVDWNKPPP